MSLLGKDFICTEDWKLEDIQRVLVLASEMKRDPFNSRWCSALKNKSFLMLFYNPSLRTHLSFETAVNELGGNAIYRSSEMSWSKSKQGIASSEALQDMARVMSRYVDGVGIRMCMNAIKQYGEGHQFVRDFAHFANIPVIGMADDRVHPCQALADVMGWSERMSAADDMKALKGKTLLVTWGSSGLARPWAAVQSHLLLAARMGMNIKLAYPEGYALDAGIRQQTKIHCEKNNATYQEIHDPNAGYEDTHVVYVRNWVTDRAYQNGEFQCQEEVNRSLSLKEWMVTEEKMKKTEKAIFSNPMPIDRNKEAEEAVIDSPYSVIYDVAENRKHVQKALLALVLGVIE